MRKQLKDIKRFEQIASVLTHYGFGFVIDSFSKTVHTPPEVRLKKVLEELGGAFLKLGQLLSLRPDLIPASYCKELSSLQDHAKPCPFKQIKQVLEDKYGNRPINTIFRSINQTPLASGSIAQVHRATLTNGKKVVIKIVKPGTKEIFEEDIDLLQYLAHKVKEHLPKVVDPETIISEFKEYTRMEFDLSIEREHIKHFSKLKLQVAIPRVFDEVCTKNVLIMQELKGTSFTHKPFNKRTSYVKKKIAEQFTTTIMEQVFIHGYFHGDPHPGNLLLMEHDKIGLVDFGIVGTLDESTKLHLTIILFALVKKDISLLAKGLKTIGIGQDATGDFEEDLRNDLGKYYGTKLDDIDFGEVFYKAMSIAKKHQIVVPKKFVVLGKTIITTESVAKLVYPDFDFVSVAKPFLKNNLTRFLSVPYVVKTLQHELSAYGELLYKLPKELNELVAIKRKEENNFTEIDQTLQHIEHEFKYVSGEFLFGMLGTLLIFGSVIASNVGMPLIYGMGLLSIVMFVYGSMMLLAAIWFFFRR